MKHKVSLSFQVEGPLTELFVYANGLPVKVSRSESKLIGGFTNASIDAGAALIITFVMIGLNGTAFKIAAQFTDNGVSESGAMPLPLEGTIENNMTAERTITYTI